MKIAIFIILAPLITVLINTLLYCINLHRSSSTTNLVPRNIFIFFALLGSFISFIISMLVFINFKIPYEVEFLNWLNIKHLNISFSLFVDNLTCIMISFISFIAFLIHIYSISYMRDDATFPKFFIYLNLFIASMFILVLSNNLLFLFVGWEGVGLCSYLLISYYYNLGANVDAGNKAFIMNRVGDAFFIIAMLIIFYTTSSLNYSNIAISTPYINVDVKILIGLFLFIGASAKSAQIPLHTWLSDAMAGPTPVSALIHAATMVTAGIYLISRFSFLYMDIHEIGTLVAYIGAFTALIAALIATRQTDIKKILAYSTISQLGYMFMAVGLGAYSAGLFHVFTHAFFKALLFLGAGAIIFMLHHEQNIFKMPSLKGEKLLYYPMLIATLAICGIPPFAGFFSKDDILLSAFSTQHYFIYAIGLFTAGLTSYYMFRLFFVVFRDRDIAPTNNINHIEKMPLIMKAVLITLSICTIISGFLGLPASLGGTNIFNNFLKYSVVAFNPNHLSLSIEYALMAIAIIISIIGIVIAYVKFARNSVNCECKRDCKIANLIDNCFYFDAFYKGFIINPLNNLSIFIKSKIDFSIKYVIAAYSLLFMVFSIAYNSITQNGNLRLYGYLIIAGIGAMMILLSNLFFSIGGL